MTTIKNAILMLTLICCYQVSAQEYTLEQKTVIGVFSTPENDKGEIFSSINKWISLNYNSAQNVIQLNDKEAGNIIVKGINEAVYRNSMKEFYPKNKHITEYSKVKFNHTIEINIKNNKFRVIYTLTDFAEAINAYYSNELNNIMFNLVDLTGLKQSAIDNYNNHIDALWKKAMVGKKKREKILGTTRPIFDEMNKGIVEGIKLTMLSINTSLANPKKDDW